MEESESMESSPQNHPNPLPAKTSGEAFKRAVKAAVGSSSHADICALFGHRVGWTAIEHWFAGRRGVPQWALDIVAARGEAILHPLRLVPPGRGLVAGKFNLPCYQKEKGAD